MIPRVFHDLGDDDSGDHKLALSLVRDLTGQNDGGSDVDLLVACEAFQAVHREMKDPRRGDTDADDDALGVVVTRWYEALDAAVAIPARTAAGQQAKLRTVFVALEDAMRDEAMHGNREEFVTLAVLAEMVGADVVLPAADREPAVAEADVARPSRLTEDAELEDCAIFDLESVFVDMRADIAIIGHIATSEREVSPDVWRRIEDHLDLVCDTLETSWKVAFEHRHVLHNVLKAERAANKALKRARIEKAAPGSAADIERAEAMWTTLRTLGRLRWNSATRRSPTRRRRDHGHEQRPGQRRRCTLPG